MARFSPNDFRSRKRRRPHARSVQVRGRSLVFRPRITTLAGMPDFPDDMPFFDEEPRPRAAARQPAQRRGALGHRRPRHGGAAGPGRPAFLSEGAEPRAAAGRRDHRRPGAGAGRRRHRKDPRAHHADRPYPGHRARLAVADPGGDLHQQGGARDEAAHRPAGRRSGRGHAVARHVSLDRRQAPAAPRRARRAEAGFHHPRHRRPGAADAPAHPGRESRRQALAGAPVRRHGRRLEEQGARRRPTFRRATREASATARAASSTTTTRSG